MIVDYLYLAGCVLFAAVLPHLTDPEVSIPSQIILQIAFLLIGVIGFKTFSD